MRLAPALGCQLLQAGGGQGCGLLQFDKAAEPKNRCNFGDTTALSKRCIHFRIVESFLSEFSQVPFDVPFPDLMLKFPAPLNFFPLIVTEPSIVRV